MNHAHLIAVGLTVGAMTVFPVADALAKSLDGAVPVLFVVWVRFFGSAVLITPLYLKGRARNPAKMRPDKRAILTEALRASIIIVAFGCFVTSFETIGLAEAMTYYSFAPIVAAGLGVVVLKERLSFTGGLALVLGLVGVLVALNPSITPARGAYFAMSSGVLFGCYLLLNRVVAVRGDPVMALFLQFWIGALLLTPLIWQYFTSEILEHTPVLGAIALVSVACNLALINAFRLAEANFLAPFLFVEIPSALLISVAFFDEVLTWNILTGASIILIAGILVMRRKPRSTVENPIPNHGWKRKTNAKPRPGANKF